jgi:hypothetical protein
MSKDYSPGALTKLSINGTAYAALSCDFGKKGTILRRAGNRGTRDHYADDARKGPYACAGTISLEPDPAGLAAIMALVIGSGGNIAESLTDFSVVVDRYEAAYTYDGVKVNRAHVHGRQGGIVGVDLELIGKTETATGNVSTPADVAPYIFADLVLTLGNASRDAFSFDLVIDNHIDGARFMNHLTLPHVVELDRTTTLQTVHAFNDTNAALYDQAVAGATGSLALNNGTTGHTFTFGTLQVPPESPAIRGKSEEVLELKMEATRSGSTASIAFA